MTGTQPGDEGELLMDQSAPPIVYRVAEVAKLLRMGERQVREGLIRGEIPGVRVGGQWRISAVAIHRWLNGEGPSGKEAGGANGLEVARAEPETKSGDRNASPVAVMAHVH
jgi:excisionase family DNA binding protein